MTKAVALRDLSHFDRDRLRAWRNHPDIRARMYTDHEISEAEHNAWFARRLADNPKLHWILTVDGQPIGLVALTNVEHGRGSLAHYIGEADYRGKGFGAAGEYLVLEKAFTDLALRANVEFPEAFAFLWDKKADDGRPVRYSGRSRRPGQHQVPQHVRGRCSQGRGKAAAGRLYREIQKSIRDSVKRLLDDKIAAFGLGPSTRAPTPRSGARTARCSCSTACGPTPTRSSRPRAWTWPSSWRPTGSRSGPGTC
jgi:hypothetical protein